MDTNKKKQIKGIIIRILISLLIVGVIILVSYLVFKKLGYLDLTKEELRDEISKTGAWGPLVFVLVSFLQVTFIPIPGAITILAGSLLFGPFLSFVYSFIGSFIGSILAFGLGRWFGRPFVNWIAGDKHTVDKYLQKSKGKENVVFFFMFLLPLFPDDLLCSVAGITKISWRNFILMQIICKPIGILATLFFMSGEIIPYHGWGLVVLAVLAVLSIIAFIIAYKNADRINNALNNFFTKIALKKQKNDKE